MSYIAFARKYRPQSFDDIIGQSHVTTTLANAISQDRVAHAYLFAGPRGVGKTTAARILAKALNCEKGPTPKPCGACASCKEITQGSSLDILEIDGASNRGIDEIRNLRDNVKFSPVKGKYKVYIIDEVHMLTPEAFNALLKTLEEPPQHVKFIFATTQPHKIPPTILSRCQRFDFHRISSSEIAANLKKIAAKEDMKIDADAIGLIAGYSDGGMRDAQVILDQIASFTKGSVAAKDVAKVLGTVEDAALFDLSGSIKDKNAARALGVLDRLINEGKDVTQICLGLIEHFRNMLITRISADIDNLIDAGGEKIKRYKTEAAFFTVEDILYIIYTFSNAMDLIKKSSLTRVPLEAGLVKLTLSHPIAPLAEIMKRVEALERRGLSLRGCEAPEAISKSGIASSERLKPHLPRNDERGPHNDNKPAAVSTILTERRPAGLEEVISLWPAIIDDIAPKKMSAASYLREGHPVYLKEKTLSIGFPKRLQFHKEALESSDNKNLVEAAIKTVLGKELKITFVLTEGFEEDDSGSAGEDSEKPETDPILKAALEIFGGAGAQ